MLTKEEVRVIIKNKRRLFEQKDCNLRNADAGSNPNCTLERTKAGFIKAKTTQLNHFIQMKDCQLLQGNTQMKETKTTRRKVESERVLAAGVPGLFMA